MTSGPRALPGRDRDGAGMAGPRRGSAVPPRWLLAAGLWWWGRGRGPAAAGVAPGHVRAGGRRPTRRAAGDVLREPSPKRRGAGWARRCSPTAWSARRRSASPRRNACTPASRAGPTSGGCACASTTRRPPSSSSAGRLSDRGAGRACVSCWPTCCGRGSAGRGSGEMDYPGRGRPIRPPAPLPARRAGLAQGDWRACVELLTPLALAPETRRQATLLLATAHRRLGETPSPPSSPGKPNALPKTRPGTTPTPTSAWPWPAACRRSSPSSRTCGGVALRGGGAARCVKIINDTKGKDDRAFALLAASMAPPGSSTFPRGRPGRPWP